MQIGRQCCRVNRWAMCPLGCQGEMVTELLSSRLEKKIVVGVKIVEGGKGV